MSEEKDRQERMFLLEEIIPDASSIFSDEPLGIEKAIEDADIVLDTNVLLIPYGAGANSLSQILTVYEGIKNRNRLSVPAQVAREFTKNRPKKLADLYQGISDKISKISLPEKLAYPILESVKEFQGLNEIIVKFSQLKSEAKTSAQSVRDAIKHWECNDPVSQAYRPIFSTEIITSPPIDKDAIYKELLRRYELGIPPGYKDSNKPDNGIGDYLIWKTILHLGETNKRSVVFVSGDEKADWQHGAGGAGFLPRFELQLEFHRISEGKDFYIIPLSKLLELQKAEESSVNEIRTEEQRIRDSTHVEIECPECGALSTYDLGESIGSSAFPLCINCDAKFHLHRTKIGVVAHQCNSKQEDSPTGEKKLEVVECPHCNSENLKELCVDKYSTAWCVCDQCKIKFPIHRRKDGSVKISVAGEG